MPKGDRKRCLADPSNADDCDESLGIQPGSKLLKIILAVDQAGRTTRQIGMLKAGSSRGNCRIPVIRPQHWRCHFGGEQEASPLDSANEGLLLSGVADCAAG